MALNDGHPEVSFNLGKERATEPLYLVSKVNVSDGLWHTLTFTRFLLNSAIAMFGQQVKRSCAGPCAEHHTEPLTFPLKSGVKVKDHHIKPINVALLMIADLSVLEYKFNSIYFFTAKLFLKQWNWFNRV